MDIEVKNCEVCNKIFEYCPKHKKRKYCSVECYRIFQKSGEYETNKQIGKNVLCSICNKEFYTFKTSKQKFCSRKCYLIDHGKRQKNKFCPICNKEFKTADRIFCSNKCYLIDHSKIMEDFKCPICKKIFQQSVKLTEKKIFCSNKCSTEYTVKSPKRNKKIRTTLKKKYKNGDRISWSKGKTKNNDIRLRKMSNKMKDAYRSGEIVIWNKGIPMTEKTKQNVSNSVTKAFLAGKMIKCGVGKSGHYFSQKNNKKLHYRSSYELIAYKILEQMSKVKYYEVEPFKIPYKYKNMMFNTIPDLLVTYTDETKELIEIKPEFKLNWDKEQFKLDAMNNYAIENGINFSIWSEKDLGLNLC